MYTIKVLSSDDFDQLPYKRAQEALGLADPKSNTAYVRYTSIPDLNKYLVDHEFEHLVEQVPTDEEDGIRYKIPFIGPVLGAIGSAAKFAVPAISGILGAVGRGIATVGSSGFGGLSRGISTIGGGIGRGVSSVGGGLGRGISSVGGQFGRGVGNIFGGIKNIGGNVSSRLGNPFGKSPLEGLQTSAAGNQAVPLGAQGGLAGNVQTLAAKPGINFTPAGSFQTLQSNPFSSVGSALRAPTGGGGFPGGTTPSITFGSKGFPYIQPTLGSRVGHGFNTAVGGTYGKAITRAANPGFNFTSAIQPYSYGAYGGGGLTGSSLFQGAQKALGVNPEAGRLEQIFQAVKGGRDLYGKAKSLFGGGGSDFPTGGMGGDQAQLGSQYLQKAAGVQYPSVPKQIPGIENLRNLINAGGGELGQTGREKLLEQLNAPLSGATSAELDAVMRQINADEEQAMDQVRDLYRNLRPGTDPSTDSSFRRDIQEVQDQYSRLRADSTAQYSRQIETSNQEARRQQIQQAIGASQQDINALMQLAQFDVDLIATQLGIDIMAAQDLKELYGGIGSQLFLQGQGVSQPLNLNLNA